MIISARYLASASLAGAFLLPSLALCGPNLLSNPSGTEGGMNGWTVIESGGDGWSTSGQSWDGDGASFVTSFNWCRRSQTIDLLAAGYPPAILDASPPIRVAEAFKGTAPSNAADNYFLRVELRDENGAVLDTWSAGSQTSPLVLDGNWRVEEHLFENYPPGVRQIYWEDGGDDAEFWLGHYGALIDGAVLEYADPAPTAIHLSPGTYPVGAPAGGVAGRLTADDNEGALHAYGLVGETQPFTLVPTGSVWSYLDDGSDQGTAWQSLLFDDSLWSTGFAELGYGEGDEATIIGGQGTHFTNYFRHRFTVDAGDLAGIQSLTLRLKRDDGAVVYLNGTEILRNGMSPGAILFDTPAPAAVSDDGQLFSEFPVSASALVAGDNVLAVEIHQQGLASSDASFDLELEAQTIANNYDNALFAIDGDLLRFAQSGPSIPVTLGAIWTVNVRVTDDGGNTLIQQLTVTGFANSTRAPTAVALSPSFITESEPLGTLVGLLSATDPDGGDFHTFQLVAGAGSSGNSSFRIEGNRLLSDTVFNSATQPSLSVRVRATDRGGLTADQILTVMVRDVNDAPSDIELTGATVALGSPAGTLVGMLATEDPDGADSHTYEFVPGVVSEPVLSFGSQWNFLDDGSDPGASGWQGPGFNDVGWKSGFGSFGYGDAQVTAVDFGPDAANKRITTYFRRTFALPLPPQNYQSFDFQVLRDDGVAVYLNGTEVARDALAPGAGAYDLANVSIGAADETTPITFQAAPGALVAGLNTLAAEVHQFALDSSDLTFDLSLSGIRDISGAAHFVIANGNEIRTNAAFQTSGLAVGTVLDLLIRSTDDRGASVERPFSVTVISGDPNDIDGDTLPDAWESQYFTDIHAQGAADDSDGDGTTNRQEYVFDTNPANRLSRLLPVVTKVGTSHLVSWPTNASRRYRLQMSSTLRNGMWVDSPAGLRQGTGGVLMETVPDGTATTRLFRLLVEMP